MTLLPKMMMKMRILMVVLLLSMVALTKGNKASEVVEESQCGLNQEGRSLQCYLRTLQSPIGPKGSDVTVVQRLHLRCADHFFLESSMSSDHFGQLPQLEELRIQYCKLRHLPAAAFSGLTNLKTLEIHSHNDDWSSVLMDVTKDTFQKLVNLRHLNLAFNNLWSLPSGSACDLINLRQLNLSHNHILDIADIGLNTLNHDDDVAHDDNASKSNKNNQAGNSGCQWPELRTIDLSWNQISAFRDGDLDQVADHLEHLDLRANRLEILSDNALASMTSLRKLNLADNQLAALPPTLFSISTEMSLSPPHGAAFVLESLQLQNNSLTLLTPGLFAGLSQLSMLNLSHNAIASHLLDADSFKGLSNLKILDLSHNRLVTLEGSILAALTSVQVLDISHNQLHTVNGHGGLASTLTIMSLSHNAISSIAEDTFEGLVSLTSLSLDHNQIRYIPDNLLQSSKLLEDLSFNGNQLNEVPSTLRYLHNLRTLDLGENAIASVRDSDFSVLTKLYGLRMAGNQITAITKYHLRNVTGLHVLNLAHNQLASIERGALDNLEELRALRLDNNFLTDINGLASSLSKLQWLNVSSNKLQWFDYAFVPKSLEWLDIQHNEVEELGNYYKLKSGFNLKRLDASGNLIRNLNKLSLPTSLEHLSLNKNAIRSIESGVFEDKPNLHRVELAHNEINHLKLSALSVGRVSPKGQPEFYLAGNPLVCDCELEWLPDINSIEMQEHHPHVVDLADIKCRLNNQPRNDTVVSVVQVPKSQFLCPYSTHCFSLCMCCEFYACDCRMQCPDGCSCFHDSSWESNIIQCGLRGHTEVPLLIPMDATVIRLDGNNLTDVDSQSFIGRKRVTSLYMNNSQVTSISSQTFSGLVNLEILHLENNNLQELVGHEFEALLSLRELYLQNNNLVRIAQSAFEAMPMLNTLRLDGNLLTNFPIWSLASSNPFLGTLFLAENMWSCDCSFAKPFRTYVHTFSDRVSDQAQIRCVTDNLVNEALLEAESYLKCPASDSNSLIEEGQVQRVDQRQIVAKDNIVTILISVVVAIVVVVGGICAICCFRSKIKNWLYHKSSEIYESRSASSSIGSEQARNNKLFDVFVCYCHHDSEFVDHTLAPTLEHGATSYRLCLHQRDFPPSASVYDTVTVATESSSRVLVVVSRAFLASEWPHVKHPLRTALQGRDSKCVFLLLDDLTSEEIESRPELKHYLKVCASVKWASPGFLNKLRFFLPEPAIQTFQRSVTLRTLQPPVSVISSMISPSSHHHVNGDSPVGSVNTQTTSVYNHQTPQVYQVHHQLHHPVPGNGLTGNLATLYSQHTYQSIPEAHIYHTLDPMVASAASEAAVLNNSSAKPPVGAVYINKNLELILKPTTPLATSSLKVDQQSALLDPGPVGSMAGTPKPSPCKSDSTQHTHTQSTLSGQQLLPNQESDEYVV